MLYHSYEMQRAVMAGASMAATFGWSWLSNPLNPLSYTEMGSTVAHALDVFAHSTQIYGKPAFGLVETEIDGKPVHVSEAIECRKPFGQLKHFVRSVERPDDPKILIVAPMSGHFATLLRGTVERLLPVADVYITDWRDAKMVPLIEGGFDLDDYIDYLIEFIEHIGGPVHMIAVCQPSVPAYAAVSLMNEQGHPDTPKTLTMMGGPIDTRESPTEVNDLATKRPLSWFEQNVIATIPAYYPGAFRRVYPGFLQLAGFMSMNLGNHMISHWKMFQHLVQGDGESAESTKGFYAEYRSVADMTAEFYLQTVAEVFQKHSLPRGEFMHRDQRVKPSAIKKTALLAVEGERDDISGLGQTKAALKLATKLNDERKRYFMVPKVGHYGIFNGRRWREVIAPAVLEFIEANR